MEKWPFENIYYRLKNNQPYLIGSRCKNCNHVAFPKREICPACVTQGNMQDVDLNRKGKIDTFSVLHVGAKGFPVPYVVGYVQMAEGPRIFALIQGDEETRNLLEIGREVELVLGKICDDEQGNEVMGFQFRCTEGKQGEGE
jgi:uncharacterized protein